MKHSRLLSSTSTAFLQQKLQLRAPYVAPLNILQVCCWVMCARNFAGAWNVHRMGKISRSSLVCAWFSTRPQLSQVSCLKTLRAIENGARVEELVPQVGGTSTCKWLPPPAVGGCARTAADGVCHARACLPRHCAMAARLLTPPRLRVKPSQDYKPSEKALALMSRGESKHPFVAGIEDTM